ncbi:hypothetical protein NS2_00940 [Nocardia seriolae NBRC 15557]|nr:hypothetical protein NS2_00940 [Nocardia seriolae NBRC 15557]
MAFQPDEGCVLPPGLLPQSLGGAELGHRQRECGEQTVVHTAVEQRGHGGQQRLGGLGRQLDAMLGNGRGDVHGRIHGALGEQRVRALDDIAPEREFGHALLGGGFPLEGVRPGAHAGGGRDQLGGLSGGQLTPGGDAVRHQDSPGDTVDHEVVGDDDEATGARAVGRFQPHEPDDLSRSRIQLVEGGVQCGRGDLDQLGVGDARVELGAVDERIRVDGSGGGGFDDPVRVRHPAQARPQHVVAVDDRADGGGNAHAIDADRQFQGHGLVEAAELAGAARHEPHHRGQRHDTHATARQLGQLRGRITLAVRGFRDGGQAGDGALLEHVARREHHAARLGAGHQLDGDDGVAAQREERVVDADPLQAEHLGEDLGNGLFQGIARRAEDHLGREDRLGQRPAVQLADRGQRDTVDDHDRGRHHVGGQAAFDMRGHGRDIDRMARRGNHVRHQRGRARGVLVADGDREVDGFVRGQGRVDLAELDTETTHLDLEVGAADVLDQAVRGPAHHVTGAVHALARDIRVRNEPVGAQARTRVVAARQLDARQVELTRDTDRNGPQPVVEDQRLHTPDRAADGDQIARHQRVADVGHDGGLGRTVAIVEGTNGAVRQCPLTNGHRPLLDQIGRYGFTTGDQHAQRVQARRSEGGQRGRGDERVGRALAADQLGELLAAVGARRDDHQGAALADGEQEFQHRRIERRRREMQCARGGVERVPLGLLDGEVGQTGVGDHDALGHTCRTGGVDDVGRVLRT